MSKLQFAWAETSLSAGCDSRGTACLALEDTAWSLPLCRILQFLTPEVF